MYPSRARRSAFTLVELLVVIAIIAVLVGLLLPAVQKVRGAAARIRCANNLKQLGVACHGYEGVRGSLPPGLTTAGFPYYGTTVFAFLLPHVEQQALADQWVYDPPGILDGGSGAAVAANSSTASAAASRAATVVPTYLCPSDPLPELQFSLPPVIGLTGYADGWFAPTSYAASAGTTAYYVDHFKYDGAFAMVGPGIYTGPQKSNEDKRLTGYTFAEIRDGLANTVLFGEKYHADPEYDRLHNLGCASRTKYPIGKWAAWGWNRGFNGTGHVMGGVFYWVYESPLNYRMPPNSACTGYIPFDRRVNAWGSGHPGGVNFVLGDGSVRFIKNEVTPTIFLQVAQRADGSVPDPSLY